MSFRRTVNHEEIRQWVSEHGGHPSALRARDGRLGVVRVDFDGFSSSASTADLQQISWSEFFEQFEQRKLAFVYKDDIEPGAAQMATKLVSRLTS